MTSKLNEIKWKKEQLWKGCMLASIAHAIMVAYYLELSNEHSWDGINYSVQNTEGARGTITFHSQYCIAAFRDDNSKRASKVQKASEYFKDASKEIMDIAESEALQYLLDTDRGKTVPVITSAFWGEGNDLYSIDEQDDMYEHGGFLLERQVMNLNDSIKAWKEYYDMTKEQCDLLESIFARKTLNPSGTFILSKEELTMIGTDDEEGLNESKTSFNEINIEWQE